MSNNTPVNDQITDAVTQTNVKVIGEAPAMAMGNIYQTAAHSTGLNVRKCCKRTKPSKYSKSNGHYTRGNANL